MELVYTHLDKNGNPDGEPYGGKDVSIGGVAYPVIQDGDRQVIREVPAAVANDAVSHHWLVSGGNPEVEAAALYAKQAHAKADLAHLHADRADAMLKRAQDAVTAAEARAAAQRPDIKALDARAKASADLAAKFMGDQLDEEQLREGLAGAGVPAKEIDAKVPALVAEKAALKK